jgi:hypothetical protein
VWEKLVVVRILTTTGFSENPAVVICLDRRQVFRESIFFLGRRRFLCEIVYAKSYHHRIL